MKPNKTKKTNSRKLADLAQVFQKTAAAEKQKAQQQIGAAKQNDSNSISEETNIHSPLVEPPTVLLENQPTPKPRVVTHSPSKIQEPINSKKEEENWVKPHGQISKKPHTQFSVYLLEGEMDKVTKLRSFLMQKGVNTNITSAQLVRVALRKLEYTDDLVELYLNVHSEDGRKRRGQL